MSVSRSSAGREKEVALARWGRLVYRARWTVLALSGLALLASLWVIHAGGRLDPPDIPSETESGRARRLLEKELPAQPSSFSLIFSSPTRQALDPAFRDEVERALAPLRRDPRVARVHTAYDPPGPLPAAVPLISRDGRRTLVLVELRGAAGGFAALEFSGLPPDLYPSLRKLIRAETLEVVSVGNVALNHDFTEVARKDLGRVEALILPAVAVLLLLVFGSVVAAALPLAVGALAMTGAMAITLLLSRCVSVSIYAPNIVSMIGLGVAIDYSLFVVSRFREEIREREPIEALARTVATAGRAILFSGLTVAIGLLGMLFLGFGQSRLDGLGRDERGHARGRLRSHDPARAPGGAGPARERAPGAVPAQRPPRRRAVASTGHDRDGPSVACLRAGRGHPAPPRPPLSASAGGLGRRDPRCPRRPRRVAATSSFAASFPAAMPTASWWRSTPGSARRSSPHALRRPTR
jgi:hypothetical protein